MNNYKIKVNSKDESKEVQELFEVIGYKKGMCSLGNYPAVIVTTQDWATENYCSTRALGLDTPAHDNYIEITLPQLRDLVVLKRSSIEDATHINTVTDSKVLQQGNKNYYWYSGEWHLYPCGVDIRPIKKPITKPLKEYLVKDPETGSYWASADRGEFGEVCEIPDGAIRARFYPHDPGELEFENAFYQWWNGKNKEWAYYADYAGSVEYSRVVWHRPTQPEELPFIDDEPRKSSFMTPEQQIRFTEGAKKVAESFVKLSKGLNIHEQQSLNDQYAEIKQVRQNGLKFDNGKPRHSLIPKGSISSVIAVLEFGAKKYEANNWQKVDNAKERYYDAAMRHIDSWWNGEKFDQETGIHHLAHAATNLFFLKWFDDKESNNG